MVLPSSLLEEEDELLSVGILRSYPTFNLSTNDQPANPLLGLPVPPYIVVARVTTVTRS
jgi:hypothetical protein